MVRKSWIALTYLRSYAYCYNEHNNTYMVSRGLGELEIFQKQKIQIFKKKFQIFKKKFQIFKKKFQIFKKNFKFSKKISNFQKKFQIFKNSSFAVLAIFAISNFQKKFKFSKIHLLRF